jgi:nitrogen regulatory protein P-II 1
MKKLEAIIRHFKLDDIRQALTERGIQGMTLTEVRGSGTERPREETYRGITHEAAFMNKLKIEVVLEDEELDQAVDAVISAAYTGKPGDGKIWVTDLVNVFRIRTGEELHAALI